MAKKKAPQLPRTESQETLEELSPLDLSLDPYNPRLTFQEKESSQAELLRIMIEKFRVAEIAESIVAAGFRPFDPLIACRHEGSLTILEGNRRVAAMKLLLKPELAPDRHRNRWEELSKRLSDQDRKEIGKVSVTVYAHRDDAAVTAYIGFRHVTGVLSWPALEKAGFIAHLIEDLGWDYRAVAEQLGSRPHHVERHYVAHQIVRQASERRLPGTENMRSTFGVLLRALQAGGVTEFLGIEYPGDPQKSRDPVPDSKQAELGCFVAWTFGTDEAPRVLRESRQLTKWGKILQSTAAVNYMKRTARPDFDRAWLKSGGQTESLVEALQTAADRLEESVPLVPMNRRDEEVQEAFANCAVFFAQMIPAFRAQWDKVCKEVGND